MVAGSVAFEIQGCSRHHEILLLCACLLLHLHRVAAAKVLRVFVAVNFGLKALFFVSHLFDLILHVLDVSVESLNLVQVVELLIKNWENASFIVVAEALFEVIVNFFQER